MRFHAYLITGTPMNAREIGQTIKKTRKTLRLTQAELASVANVGVRTLSEIENGKETAHIGLVLKVLDALGIDVRLDVLMESPSTQ